MTTQKEQSTGGLVLVFEELQNILNESDSVGLAFGLEQAGHSPDVNLLVYKVSREDGNLHGELRAINNRFGAPKFDKPHGDVELFHFGFMDVLMNCGFDFAYVSKEDFAEVMENGEPEVFISGAKLHHGSESSLNGEWFTLKIEPRNEDVERILGNPPKAFHMSPCPPIWAYNSDKHESLEGLSITKVFSKNLEIDLVSPE